MQRYSNALLMTVLMIFPGQYAMAETLETAWQIALANNPQIKAAQANTQVSKQQLQSIQGQQLPSLNISTGYTQYSEELANKIDIPIKNIPLNQFNTAQMGSAKAQAVASLPLFTSGRLGHAINAAEATLQAVEANGNTAILNLKMQVAEAYTNVLRHEINWQIAKTHVSQLVAHQHDVKNLFEQGMAAPNDVLSCNIEQIRAQQNVIKINNQFDNAKAQYNQLLVRNFNEAVKLSDTLPTLPDGNLDQFNQMAIQQRSELTALSRQIEMYQQQAQSVKAEQLPQVTLNGGYVYQQNHYQVNQGMWMVNVDVEWKLFDGSTAHKSNALLEQVNVLKQQRDDLINQINLQIRQTWMDIQETRQRIDAMQQTVDQANENNSISLENYKQGLTSSADVLKAEELLITSLTELNNAKYDHALAILKLRRFVGLL